SMSMFFLATAGSETFDTFLLTLTSRAPYRRYRANVCTAKCRAPIGRVAKPHLSRAQILPHGIGRRVHLGLRVVVVRRDPDRRLDPLVAEVVLRVFAERRDC